MTVCCYFMKYHFSVKFRKNPGQWQGRYRAPCGLFSKIVPLSGISYCAEERDTQRSKNSFAGRPTCTAFAILIYAEKPPKHTAFTHPLDILFYAFRGCRVNRRFFKLKLSPMHIIFLKMQCMICYEQNT